MPSISFRNRAVAAFAAIIVLLASGMVFALRRLDSLASAGVAHIQAKEMEITSVERLRWRGERIVSIGRGFIISGDPDLRAALQRASTDFDAGMQEVKSSALSPRGAELAAESERSARAFRRVQDDVLMGRDTGEPTDKLAQRFETEMLPLHEQFADSLDRLVEHKEMLITKVYAELESARARWTFGMYGLLAALVLASLGIAWTFSGLLARSYRETQEALVAARNAVAARDELTGIIAHDLRNPLGSITMRAFLLKQAADAKTTQRHATAIENVARQMDQLIKTMLDVATLEAGKLSMTPERCEVKDLLRATLEVFDNLFAAKHVRLESHVNDASLAVRADRGRVLQVLSNLLGNALKFTPSGGKVGIRVEREREMVHFTVSDTGPGIPSEDLPRLFDRFWKHDTPEKKGTGLGLFIAKGIITAHGGALWVESTLERGSRFHFTIPLFAAPSTALAEPARLDSQPALPF